MHIARQKVSRNTVIRLKNEKKIKMTQREGAAPCLACSSHLSFGALPRFRIFQPPPHFYLYFSSTVLSVESKLKSLYLDCYSFIN